MYKIQPHFNWDIRVLRQQGPFGDRPRECSRKCTHSALTVGGIPGPWQWCRSRWLPVPAHTYPSTPASLWQARSNTQDLNIFPATYKNLKPIIGELKGSGSWVRQSYCVFIHWPLRVQRLRWTPGRACLAEGDTHSSLPVTRGADTKQAQLPDRLTGICDARRGLRELTGLTRAGCS